MATQDFNLSFTVEIPALFNEPTLGKQGGASTIFADVVSRAKQGGASTIFADLAILEKDGAASQFDASNLCDEASTLDGTPYSTMSGPPYNSLLGCD